MTKIIFLDIDGVLTNRKSLRKRFDSPDPDCIARLNAITEHTDAKLVLSSSWRIGRTVVECRELLSNWGVKAPLIGKTPHMPAWIRGEEILDWICDYTEHRDLDTFVILDDDADMGGLLPRLVRCQFEFGLTDVEMNDCIRRLR